MSEPTRTSQRKSLSPWGELYAQLLRAESIEHRRTPDQHALSTRFRAEEAVQALNAAHTANQERRERVLRHPDLATQLRDVLGVADASRWNGYVPPAQVPGSVRFARTVPERVRRSASEEERYFVANTSPVRRRLVEICAEAFRRERAVDGDG
ncbi:hypothetical protein [Actinophytocola sediminis]